MKRVLFVAFVLMAVLVPLAGVAHADLRSDEAQAQAP